MPRSELRLRLVPVANSSAMPRFSSTVSERNGLGIWNERAIPSRVR